MATGVERWSSQELISGFVTSWSRIMSSRFGEKKIDEDAAIGQLGPDFATARPMWNAEVAIILQHHIKQAQAQAANNTNSAASAPVISQMITDTLTYVNALNNYPSKEAQDAVHSLHTDRYAWLSEWELALINNLRIDEYEECLSLIPTIRQRVERGQIEQDTVEQMLADIKKYQSGAT